jgi:hypothetical protein
VSDQCKAWSDSTGACTDCYDGYGLSGGECVIKTTQPGQTTVPNCAQVSANGQYCTRCAFRYYNYNGVCNKVSDQCKAWSDSTGACTDCYDGYGLSGGECVIKTTQPGQTTVPNCAQVSANGQYCTRCAFRYYNYNGVCNKVSDQCKAWSDSTGACTDCYDGYGLSGGECVIKTTQPGQTTVPNCAQVSANGQYCTRCAFRYYNYNGVCNKVSDQCKAWSDSTGACTDCYDGYGLSGGECVIKTTQPGQTTVPNCAQVSANGQYCTRCAFRYYNYNGVCNKVSDQCKAWSDSTGACTDCYDGYGLSGGECVIKTTQPGQTTVPNCAQVSANGQYCTRCAFRYYNYNGVCNKVSDQCKAWSDSTGACTDCYDGYGLSGGECVIKTTQPGQTTVPNCAQVSANGQYCTRCAFRYYNYNGVCNKVSDQCKAWSDSTGACTDCYDGYGLSGGECVIKTTQPGQTTVPNCAQVSANGQYCTRCAFRYYNYNGVCNKVSDQCKAWSDSTGACTDCYDGYGLSGGECVIKTTQPGQTTVPNCAQVSANGQYCTRCAFRYYNYNGVCNKVSDDSARLGVTPLAPAQTATTATDSQEVNA